jgi:peptide subunit release factor 1 (eRF1)
MYTGTYHRLDVHVYASNREVITKASRKILSPKARFDRKVRHARHAFYRELLEIHANARDLVTHFRL